ncbi:thioesterase family protein [Patulibacter sp. S7RM1-6]
MTASDAIAVVGGSVGEDADAPVAVELTDAARGPWDAGSAHGGAPAALLARAVEARAAAEDLRVSSLAYTFLGPVPLGPVELRTRIRKAGRRLQVVHGELRADGRTAMEVQATLLRRGRVPLPSGVGMPWPELPPPEGLAAAPGWFVTDGGRAFHPDAIEIRPIGDAPLGTPTPEGAAAWLRLRLPVAAGERPSPAQRAAAAADFGNGLSCPVPMEEWVFVNCDLHVALHRDPAGEWIGLRARTEVDRAGTGLTTTELHDAAGRFGTATQTLFVEPRA